MLLLVQIDFNALAPVFNGTIHLVGFGGGDGEGRGSNRGHQNQMSE